MNLATQHIGIFVLRMLVNAKSYRNDQAIGARRCGQVVNATTSSRKTKTKFLPMMILYETRSLYEADAEQRRVL